MPALTIPNTFSATTLARSSEVNANFNAVAVLLNSTKLDNTNIQTGGIATANLADSAVTTIKINDSAVTTAKINDAAVLTAKIADLNVTTAKIAASGVTTAKIADANVTIAKLELRPASATATAGQVAISSSSGSQSVAPFETALQITNQSVTLTTVGRPVRVGLQADGSANNSDITVTTAAVVQVSLYRDATLISKQQMSSGTGTSYPVGAISYLDTGLAAGTYVYTAKITTAAGDNPNATVNYVKLVAYEI